jgi:hypothetical protein
LDRIVCAYLGAPTAVPDWREVALSIARGAEDPLRHAIIDDFIRRVDRSAQPLPTEAESPTESVEQAELAQAR